MGSLPRSPNAARTASVATPASTRSCSSRRSMNSSTAARDSSVTGMGCTAAAAPIALFKSIRVPPPPPPPPPPASSTCSSPTAARRTPYGSAVAVGAHPAANRPTRESNLSATETRTPAALAGNSSPAFRGSTDSNIAAATAGSCPSRRA